jgi:hypothetical protein
MGEASVKGLLLQGSVESIRVAIEQGAITRESVELMLEADDIEIFDSKINPTSWYPIGLLGRAQEILAKLVGGDRIGALEQIGASGADLIRDSGTYGQLDFKDGNLAGAEESRVRLFTRQSATLHEIMFNRGKCRMEMEEGGKAVLMHYEDVGEFPNSMRYVNTGFTAAVSAMANGEEVPVTLENQARDRYTIRIGSNA